MKKDKQSSRDSALGFSRQTIRRLTDDECRQVAGGTFGTIQLPPVLEPNLVLTGGLYIVMPNC